MSNYPTHLLDELSAIGNLSVRRMFGAFGLFHFDTMIGIIADDELYLKGVDAVLPQFTEQDCQRFCYQRAGNDVYLN